MTKSSSGAPPPDDVERELAERLLGSARYDGPGPSARRRTLEAGLAVLEARAPARRSRTVLAGLAGMSVAAAAAFALFSRADGAKMADVRPETTLPAHSTSEKTKQVVTPPRPCPEVVVASGKEPLLENWEERDSLLLRADGRSGNWLTFDDGTGKQNVASSSQLLPSPIVGGRSRQGLHLSGGRFAEWGVAFGTDFATGACYDATAYDGIEFWAKGPAAIYVGVQVIDVQSPKFGGFCEGEGCYNSHRKRVGLGADWQRYSVRWEELQQLNPRQRVPLDIKRVRFLEFAVFPEDTPFDIWLDDVSLLPKDGARAEAVEK
jgi:hypothetical protein